MQLHAYARVMLAFKKGFPPNPQVLAEILVHSGKLDILTDISISMQRYETKFHIMKSDMFLVLLILQLLCVVDNEITCFNAKDRNCFSSLC